MVAFWATPHMTLGHLIFAAASSGFILVAIQLEERDLIGYFGPRYNEYRKNVRMLIPLPKKKAPASPSQPREKIGV